MKVLFIALFLTVTTGFCEEAVDQLRKKYYATKNAGFSKVYGSYLSDLLKLKKAAMASADLDGTNAVVAEMKVVEEMIKAIHDGADAKFLEELGPEAAKLVDGKFGELKTRYLKRLSNATSELNSQYRKQCDELTKKLLKAGNLEGANAVATFKAELGGGENAIPSAPEKEVKATGLGNLANQSRWKKRGGSWEFSGNSLIGKGNGEIFYEGRIPSRFTLAFDVEVASGIRPRITLGKYTVGNDADKRKWILFPRIAGSGKQNGIPLKMGAKESFKIIVNRNEIGFSANGELIDEREEEFGRFQTIKFSCGDSYSGGEVTFSNIRFE